MQNAWLKLADTRIRILPHLRGPLKLSKQIHISPMHSVSYATRCQLRGGEEGAWQLEYTTHNSQLNRPQKLLKMPLATCRKAAHTHTPIAFMLSPPPFLPQPLNWFATPSAHILISRICCKASNLMHLKTFRKVSDNNRDWLWQRRAGRGAWHCVWGRAAERGVLRVGGLKTQLANEIIAKRFKHAKWQHLAQREGETSVFQRRKTSLFRLQIKS